MSSKKPDISDAGSDREQEIVKESLNGTTLQLLGDEPRPTDPEIERRVVRKIDLFLIPAMVIGYGLVYCDKAIPGSAVFFGMAKVLQLSVVDTSVSLGFTEAIVPTAFVITTSGYYTQLEQALRQTWWFSGTGWFTIIGGALIYGFAQIEGGSLAPWQYIYLLAGSFTFVFGLLCFSLPNSALDTGFLTPEERLVAVEHLRSSQTGVRDQEIRMDQIKEAALDPKIWLVALTMALAYTVNGAVSGFGPLIVSTSSYSTLESIIF